jgi:hypothetical protein
VSSEKKRDQKEEEISLSFNYLTHQFSAPKRDAQKKSIDRYGRKENLKANDNKKETKLFNNNGHRTNLHKDAS